MLKTIKQNPPWYSYLQFSQTQEPNRPQPPSNICQTSVKAAHGTSKTSLKCYACGFYTFSTFQLPSAGQMKSKLPKSVKVHPPSLPLSPSFQNSFSKNLQLHQGQSRLIKVKFSVTYVTSC
jgi:hypothetical protein